MSQGVAHGASYLTCFTSLLNHPVHLMPQLPSALIVERGMRKRVNWRRRSKDRCGSEKSQRCRALSTS